MVVPNEPEHVFPSVADSAAVVIPDQADGPSLTAIHRNTALGICIRFPEQEAVESLLALKLKLARERNRESDPDFVITHNGTSTLTLRSAWRTLRM